MKGNSNTKILLLKQFIKLVMTTEHRTLMFEFSVTHITIFLQFISLQVTLFGFNCRDRGILVKRVIIDNNR